MLLCGALPIRWVTADDGPEPRNRGEAAADSDDGLEVGAKVQQFYVRAVTGPHKGRSVCYVCRNGERPVVMLLVREVTPELPKLLRAVDEVVDQNRAVGLRGFGVFVGRDSKEVLPEVQTLAFNEKILLPLTVAAAPMEGPSGKKLADDAAVAVILYREQRVVANYTCRAGELNDERIESIVAGIRGMTRCASEERRESSE